MSMVEHDTAFQFPVRVYYEDTDASGVVYHANYLHYFERARTEWLGARGYDQAALMNTWSIAFTLSALDLRFHRPARLDDRLVVTVGVSRRQRVRLSFEQRIFQDDNLLVQGEFTVACVSIPAFRPTRLPPGLHEELL